jgi:hypothetical protein
MKGFLAYITPVDSGAHPEHPIAPGGSPPGIWGPTDPRPTPPIVIPPGAIDGVHPEHPIYIPVYPAHPIVIPPGSIVDDPPFPAHPIVIPPGIWGPTDPMPTPPIVIPQPPGGGPPVVIWPSPGHPEHPIVIPLPPLSDAHPEHPIVLPPPEVGIPGFPTHPIVIPPESQPHPEHPIVLPPETGGGAPPEKLIEWHAIWTGETNGWVVIGVPNVPHPAPAKK